MESPDGAVDADTSVPESLIIDLRELVTAAEQDWENESFVAYADHIKEFNRLLSKIQEFGLASDMLPVADVPYGQRAFVGFSTPQQAKLREVQLASRRLLMRVRPALGASEERASDMQAKEIIETLFARFHVFVKQLRSRHGERETLNVNDEHDVQDLIHALLRLFFEDVRAEEYAPSYAGKASRMDFLLKGESIVVETKMTRQGLGAKEVGSQLIEDISRYKEHPSCRHLFCLVYDPMGFVANPGGLEKDLSQSENSDGRTVRVVVVPKGT